MAEIKWIKISCDLFNDEAIRLIEQMPDGDAIIVIWLKLLITAGKINDNGFLYFRKEIPYTDEMLSTVFNRPLNTIRLALSTFEHFGMIQIVTQQGIYITNWEKYQNLAGMEQIKEYNRIAKRRQREKQKALKMLSDSQGQCQGQIIDNHETEKDIDKDIDKEKELDEEINKEEKKEKKKNFVAKSFFQKLIASDKEIKKYNFLSDSFMRFLQYKTDIKKQFKTGDSVRSAFLKFVRLSNNNVEYAEALVENTIARGWQTIYDLPKEDKNAFLENQTQKENQEVSDKWEKYSL